MTCLTTGDTTLLWVLQAVACVHLSADEIHNKLRPGHHPPENSKDYKKYFWWILQHWDSAASLNSTPCSSCRSNWLALHMTFGYFENFFIHLLLSTSLKLDIHSVSEWQHYLKNMKQSFKHIVFLRSWWIQAAGDNSNANTKCWPNIDNLYKD